MTRLDKFLAYAESNRLMVCAIAIVLIGLIAWVDWLSPDTSVGFLYLVPVLLSAAALNGAQILVMAVLCGYLREVFDPLQGAPLTSGRCYGMPSILSSGCRGRTEGCRCRWPGSP